MRGVTAALMVCLAAPAFAAECLQDRAIYVDGSGGYTLRFRPVESSAAVTSQLFSVVVEGTDVVLDGHVIDSEAPVRPVATLLFNCPEGDATGAELEACRIWENVLYTINADGTAGVIDRGPAAAQLILPDFARALHQSTAFGNDKATVNAGDVFQLKGCAA